MKFTRWCRHALRTHRPCRRVGAVRCRPRPVLRLESLEDRLTPATLTVSSAADSTDSGSGSLRAVIAAAKAGDTIVFASGLSNRTLALTLGPLAITRDLDIEGPGASLLTISGHDASRVFDVSGAATVTIDGLTIADGSVTGDESTTLGGGGILNEAGATLKLKGDTLHDNTATASSDTVDVFGGGLLNEGSATVVSCTFSGNQALGGGGSSFFAGSVGGGIDNFGGATLSVTDSTFTANQALGSGAGDYGIGGALENNAGLDNSAPSTATIDNCLFTDNLAGGVAGSAGTGVLGNGGAIDNEGTGSTLTLSNATVRGNQSGEPTASGSIGLGGGLLTYTGSTTTVLDSTVSDNRAVAGPGEYANGGGICTQSGSIMYLMNSTVVGNQSIGGAGAVGVGADGLGTLVGQGLGGGIMNTTGSTLTVQDSTIAGNQALGGDGGTAGIGQILNQPGGALGGGIDNFIDATLTLLDSTVSGNLARGGSTNAGIGGQALGGGIHNQSSTLALQGSTVVGNLAIGGNGGSGLEGGLAGGGGLENSQRPGINGVSGNGPANASVLDSIFSNNQALGGNGGSGASGGNGVGGGIGNGFYSLVGFPDNSTVTVNGSTLANNPARGGAGGNSGVGLGGGLVAQIAFPSQVPNPTLEITVNGNTDTLSLDQVEQNGPVSALPNIPSPLEVFAADRNVYLLYQGDDIALSLSGHDQVVQVAVSFAIPVLTQLPPPVLVAQGTSLPGAELTLVATLFSGILTEGLPASNTPALNGQVLGPFLPFFKAGVAPADRGAGEGALPEGAGAVVAKLAPTDVPPWQAFRLGVDQALRERLSGQQTADRLTDLLIDLQGILDQILRRLQPPTSWPDRRPQSLPPLTDCLPAVPVEDDLPAVALDLSAGFAAAGRLPPQRETRPPGAGGPEGSVFACGSLLPSRIAPQERPEDGEGRPGLVVGVRAALVTAWLLGASGLAGNKPGHALRRSKALTKSRERA